MDYTWKNEDNQTRGGILQALEVLETVKQASQNPNEVYIIKLIKLESKYSNRFNPY